MPAPTAKPHIVTPRSFNEAQEIGDHYKEKLPVIINLQPAERDLSRRIIDFASGLCYGLAGRMERVAFNLGRSTCSALRTIRTPNCVRVR